MSRDERGFTLVTVMGALLAVTLLSIAALAYAQNDLRPGAHDRDRKIAYAAAEAGVQNYAYYLTQDPTYWSKCDNDTGAYTTPPQINQRWNGTGSDPRTWVRVPNTADRWYTIELLPANGASSCNVNDAQASMIDAATGTFRLRATGRVGTNGAKRSIVVNFRRKSLLDYIYFTDKETRSPILYPVEVGSRPTRTPANCSGASCRDLKQWAIDSCDRYFGDRPQASGGSGGGREDQDFDGQIQTAPGGSWSNFELPCNTINFIDADSIAGPFHTNDEFSCSGSPDFGLTVADRIETSSAGQTANPATGYRGCSPNFIGTPVRSADALDIPPTNGALYRDAAASYRFVGRTQITLNGANMTVIGTRENGQVLASPGVTMAIPPDGVVYVSNSAPNKPAGSPGYACGGYNVLSPYAYQTAVNDGCGNLEIKGAYSANVTFTAENDIVVMDDLTRPAGNPPSPDVLLGLISNNFIRVYHPVTGCESYGCNFLAASGCTNNGGPGSITIDAAILSLNQSFIVDNWHCGANLGSLTVRGAIVQKFRGAVGRGSSGYTKSYSYDTRLRYRSPPEFLDPVQAAWKIQTYNEQVPAR